MVLCLPEYVMVPSLLLSRGGAQCPHIACMEGNVTPWETRREISVYIM